MTDGEAAIAEYTFRFCEYFEEEDGSNTPIDYFSLAIAHRVRPTTAKKIVDRVAANLSFERLKYILNLDCESTFRVKNSRNARKNYVRTVDKMFSSPELWPFVSVVGEINDFAKLLCLFRLLGDNWYYKEQFSPLEKYSLFPAISFFPYLSFLKVLDECGYTTICVPDAIKFLECFEGYGRDGRIKDVLRDFISADEGCEGKVKSSFCGK